MTTRRGFVAALGAAVASARALLAGDTDNAAAVLPVSPPPGVSPDSQSSTLAAWFKDVEAAAAERGFTVQPQLGANPGMVALRFTYRGLPGGFSLTPRTHYRRAWIDGQMDYQTAKVHAAIDEYIDWRDGPAVKPST